MARPSGTVTLVFTDIEGSTRQWDNDPEVMRAPIALHDVLLRSASGAFGVWLSRLIGDGVSTVFVRRERTRSYRRTVLSALRRIQPDHAE